MRQSNNHTASFLIFVFTLATEFAIARDIAAYLMLRLTRLQLFDKFRRTLSHGITHMAIITTVTPSNIQPTGFHAFDPPAAAVHVNAPLSFRPFFPHSLHKLQDYLCNK